MSNKSWWDTSPERFMLAQAYHQVAEVIGWDAAIAFGMKVWETKRPPSSIRPNATAGGGRGVIYIPKTLNVFFGRELVALVGTADALKLATAFGGEHLEFPCIAKASVRRRNSAITAQVASGTPVRTVAAAFGLTEQHIRRIAKSTPSSQAA